MSKFKDFNKESSIIHNQIDKLICRESLLLNDMIKGTVLEQAFYNRKTLVKKETGKEFKILLLTTKCLQVIETEEVGIGQIKIPNTYYTSEFLEFAINDYELKGDKENG